jgi:hypothetical protein
MSTNAKPLTGYCPFEFNGKTVSLCINQMRIVSLKRILSRKGNISEERLITIKEEICRFFYLVN